MLSQGLLRIDSPCEAFYINSSAPKVHKKMVSTRKRLSFSIKYALRHTPQGLFHYFSEKTVRFTHIKSKRSLDLYNNTDYL